MTDLRKSLEREARRVEAGPDALAATRRRAQRQRAQRRVVSGAVALAVAATGIVVAVRSFEGRGAGPRPAGPPAASASLPIWPYLGTSGGDVHAIDAIQAQVDQGHQPWYLSPRIVAEVFAMEALEWERPDIQASVRGDDPVHVAIANPALSGQMGDVRTILTMERWRGRADGIFVITRADAEILDLRFPVPGQDILDSEELTFAGALQGISQRLLALTVTVNIEGTISFASDESLPSEVEVTEGPGPADELSPEVPQELLGSNAEVVPGPDGEFETTVPMPKRVPPNPGISVFVHDSTGNKIAVESFRLGEVAPITLSPVPGPTPTSDDATPAPVLVEVADGTGHLHATSYLGAILQDRGRGTHHGGYSIVFPMEDAEIIDRTVISFGPGQDDEAERLRRLFFPDAEMRERIPESKSVAQIRIHLGRDFLVTEEEGLAVFNSVFEFLDRRLIGSGAERYLSPEARRLYETRRGGLSLYGYATNEVGVTGLRRDDGLWRAVVILNGTRYETLELTRVSDNDITQWSITYAERNS